jgi:SAM-dependent methyltransferase
MSDTLRRMDPKPPRYLAERPAWLHRRHWSNPYRYINSLLLATVAAAAARLQLPRSARVLDFGCGESPYRDCFEGADFVGADLPGNPRATVVLGDDWRVPLPDATIDVVLSTQVLEHVAYPDRYLAECHRLLKPGGTLLLTTHGMMVYHRDPVDYWRWTGEGLQRTLTENAFAIQRFTGLMGLSAVAVQLFQDASLLRVPGVLRKPYVWVLQTLASLFDRLHSDESRTMNALVFAVVATRR